MARHKEFNPEKALDRAMQLFWQQGYLATSIDDLVAATGVQRYGLYSTFGGKHALFLQALDHYLDTVVTGNLAVLEADESSPAAIERFFYQFATRADLPEGAFGCLLFNSAAELAADDEAVAEKMDQYVNRLASGFETAIRQAQAENRLGSGVDPQSGGQYLASVALSLFGLARTGMRKEQLFNYVVHALRGFIAQAAE